MPRKERGKYSISNQSHEIKFEAGKMNVKSADIKVAKKSGSKQRKDVEKKCDTYNKPGYLSYL